MFELKERKAFWLRKRQRDHRWTRLMLYLPILILQIVGMGAETPQCTLAGTAFTPALIMWLNNSRDSYVEHPRDDENLADPDEP